MDEAKRLRRLKSALGRLNGVVPAGGGPAPSVASRLNAVDELAALADEWLADTSVVEQERNRRAQRVITALCDYLRSPANDCDTAPADAAHLSAAGRIRTHILDTIRQHVRWRENPHPAEPMHAELSVGEDAHPLAAELNQPPKPGAVLPGPWSHLAFNFSYTVFYDVVDLGEAYWAGPVTFDGATFTHDAYFCNSLYGEDAVFSRCEYRGYVLFSNSTYCGAASFAESTYHNIVYFSDSVYERCAVFTDSNYRAAADYGCSTYNAGADFSGCTHHGTVTYHMSAYGGETNFTNSLARTSQETVSQKVPTSPREHTMTVSPSPARHLQAPPCSPAAVLWGTPTSPTAPAPPAPILAAPSTGTTRILTAPFLRPPQSSPAHASRPMPP